MVATGWISEAPDAGPALPVTNFILSQRAAPAGPVTLGQAVGRVLGQAERPVRYGAEPEREDPDERAAALVRRGYVPGQLYELQQRLGDVEAEAEAEREKIAAGAKRAEHVRRAYEAGQIRAWDIPAALGDEGDEGRMRLLERRAESLRAQIADVTEIMTPPQARPLNAVEDASSRARRILADVAGWQRGRH
jgi:hypothetical protein